MNSDSLPMIFSGPSSAALLCWTIASASNAGVERP